MEKEGDLIELLAGIDYFASAMRKAVLERHNSGQEGWKEQSQEHLEYLIKQAANKISNNPLKDIDIANLCAIHYLNRRK